MFPKHLWKILNEKFKHVEPVVNIINPVPPDDAQALSNQHNYSKEVLLICKLIWSLLSSRFLTVPWFLCQISIFLCWYISSVFFSSFFLCFPAASVRHPHIKYRFFSTYSLNASSTTQNSATNSVISGIPTPFLFSYIDPNYTSLKIVFNIIL